MEKDKVDVFIKKEPFITTSGEELNNPLNTSVTHTFVRLTEIDGINKPNLFRDRSFNTVVVLRQDLDKIAADIEKRNKENKRPFEKESVIIFE